MKARTGIIVVATIIISVRLADAQKSTKVPRIGFLSPESHQSGRFEAFRQGLRELGYVEGKNITIEHRSSEDNAELKRLATEMVQEKVAVLVTQGRATVQAKNAAANVPHVFGMSGDPVEAGVVRSLAQPGGNMTGITFLAFELVGKRLEILKEAISRGFSHRCSCQSSPSRRAARIERNAEHRPQPGYLCFASPRKHQR